MLIKKNNSYFLAKIVTEKEKNIYNLRKMPYMLKDGGLNFLSKNLIKNFK